MQVYSILALSSVLAVAACSDATAPQPSRRDATPAPDNAASNATLSRAGTATADAGGSVSVVASKPMTFNYATVDCNYDAIAGTMTVYSLSVAALGQQGSFFLAGQFEQIKATGATGITYTGSQLQLAASLITPNGTLDFTDFDFDLRANAKGKKDTFIDFVTIFVNTPQGPTITDVYANQKCSPSGPYTRQMHWTKDDDQSANS